MESVIYNIGQVLGITILHSLWQGLLIYIVLRVVFSALPALSPAKKYNLALSAISAMFLWFMGTLFMEVRAYNWASLNAAHLSTGLILAAQHYQARNPSFYNVIGRYLPYISIIYIAGLLINVTRLALGWNRLRVIKNSIIPAVQMQQYINTFSKVLNIGKQIQLKFSNRVDVPCIIGYFKPLILLPVSIATYLSACEVEAILLHELAHIKRNDYLVNIIQQFITVVLFFNPCAQLVNRLINQERENGCDDLVVEKTGNPLIYAQALLKLEETRNANLPFALAATGKKYHLLNRIERIMKTNKPTQNIRHLFIALALLAGSLSSIAWLNPTEPALKPEKTADSKDAAKHSGNSDARLATLTDSDIYLSVNDTTKHKKGEKTLSSSKKGIKKADKSDKDVSRSAKNKTKNKTFRFNEDSNFHDEWSDSLKKYYSSPEWKKQMEAMRLQGEEMRKKFESPEWKNQMAAIKLQGEEMRKKFESPEWKKQMEDMKIQGEEMRKKFESPEWKKQMEDIKIQGEEMRKKFESPEWKKQMEDIKIQGEEMRKKFESPEWKKQMEDIKIKGEAMRKKFESPEWKKQMEAMKLQGEEMRKKFESPEWKKQMEEIRKHGEEMRKKFDSPEWKKKMKDMKWDLEDSTKAGKDTVGK